MITKRLGEQSILSQNPGVEALINKLPVGIMHFWLGRRRIRMDCFVYISQGRINKNTSKELGIIAEMIFEKPGY